MASHTSSVLLRNRHLITTWAILFCKDNITAFYNTFQAIYDIPIDILPQCRLNLFLGCPFSSSLFFQNRIPQFLIIFLRFFSTHIRTLTPVSLGKQTLYIDSCLHSKLFIYTSTASVGIQHSFLEAVDVSPPPPPSHRSRG